MDVLMKLTNKFTLYRVAPLRVVLELVTSLRLWRRRRRGCWLRTGTWTRGDLGRIESETAERRAVRGEGSTNSAHPTDPHLYKTVALFQHLISLLRN